VGSSDQARRCSSRALRALSLCGVPHFAFITERQDRSLATIPFDRRTLLQVWAHLGIDRAELGRAALADLPAENPESDDTHPPYASSSKRVIEYAMREASALNDDTVEPNISCWVSCNWGMTRSRTCSESER
jgi:hypothetical protein